MRALLPVAVALAAIQLGGCVAAALVPLAAGGAVAKRSVDISDEKAAPKPVVTVGAGVSQVPPTLQPPPPSPPAEAVAEPVLAIVSEPLTNPLLPARTDGVSPTPRLAQDEAGYAAMTAYVLRAMGDGKPLPGRASALIDQRSLATVPRMAMCTDQRPALLIDLDPGDKAFDLDDPPSPEPGLAEHLRMVRGRGVAVVWMATLPQSAERDLLTILKATGLDPLGIDKTLLLRRGEARKQQIILRASDNWCVLAIAGDRRSDFDEVFDYLRNPDGPVALALEQHIGAGWFLVPPPIR